MLSQSARSKLSQTPRSQFWPESHHVVLTIMWLVTTITMLTMLWLNVRDTGRYSELRYMLQAGYVAALLWYLSRSGPSTSQLPVLRPLVFPRWQYSVWIPVVVIAIVFILTAISDGDAGILALIPPDACAVRLGDLAILDMDMILVVDIDLAKSTSSP